MAGAAVVHLSGYLRVGTFECCAVVDAVAVHSYTVRTSSAPISLTKALLTIGFMYFLSWRLATVAFVTVPNVVIASKIFGNFIRRQTKEIQGALAASTAAAEEALGTMRTVKSLHAEAEMGARCVLVWRATTSAHRQSRAAWCR